MLSQVLEGVDQGPGGRDPGGIGGIGAEVGLTDSAPVDGLGVVEEREAVGGPGFDERSQGGGIFGGGEELGVAVASGQEQAEGDAQPGVAAAEGVSGEGGDRVGAGAGGLPVEGVEGEAFEAAVDLVDGVEEGVAGGG